MRTILGIDVGASGIKGGLVNVETGELIGERLKLPTPQPATPHAMADTVADLVKQMGYEGDLIGCGFPAIIHRGVCLSAANIDQSWIGASVEDHFSQATGIRVIATNDADAAGVAEMHFGKGKGVKGSVLLITIGSGLGSALFTDGHLVRNTEFGHIPMHGGPAEHYVSNTARKKYDMDWETFGSRFNEYLLLIDRLFTPDLVILGGGVSNDFQLFTPYLTVKTPITTALMFNNAGIVGAAMYASDEVDKL